MSELTPLVGAQHGAFFLARTAGGGTAAAARSPAYGLLAARTPPIQFRIGRGAGRPGRQEQAGRSWSTTSRPATSRSAPGSARRRRRTCVVLPILFEDQVLGRGRARVVQHGSRDPASTSSTSSPRRSASASTRSSPTPGRRRCSSESQRLTAQLQERSAELQRDRRTCSASNAELEEKAALLAKQNRAIEVKNSEIEQARRTLEERAQQLALLAVQVASSSPTCRTSCARR